MTGRTNKFSIRRKVVFAGAAVGISCAALAANAHAAPDSDWDRLAECESGGDWGINTGNGFKGGLQFTESTWSAFGGQDYATTADQASREQQIAVAENVLAEQGWNAWPTCSQKLGLNSGPTERSAPIELLPEPAPEVASPRETAQETAQLATAITEEAAPELTGEAIEASHEVAQTAAETDLLDELTELITVVKPLIKQAVAELFGS